MIFITVGTQLPFDRLIQSLDDYFTGLDDAVFAQVGPSDIKLKNIPFADFVSPSKADELFQEASLIIAHAGMGSILTALKYKKPILVVPRKASLGEHRNEHQMATAEWVKKLPGVIVADDEKVAVEFLKKRSELINGHSIPEFAEERLLQFVTDYIQKN